MPTPVTTRLRWKRDSWTQGALTAGVVFERIVRDGVATDVTKDMTNAIISVGFGAVEQSTKLV